MKIEPFDPRMIAIFSTSDIQTYQGNKLVSTGYLESAIKLRWTCYVVTTRQTFTANDVLWREKVNGRNIFLADGGNDCNGANSPGLIAPWIKLFTALGVVVPNGGFHTWQLARDTLQESEFRNRVIVLGSDFRTSQDVRLCRWSFRYDKLCRAGIL